VEVSRGARGAFTEVDRSAGVFAVVELVIRDQMVDSGRGSSRLSCGCESLCGGFFARFKSKFRLTLMTRFSALTSVGVPHGRPGPKRPSCPLKSPIRFMEASGLCSILYTIQHIFLIL
jgi:hypothetical protein